VHDGKAWASFSHEEDGLGGVSAPPLLFTDDETNSHRLFGTPSGPSPLSSWARGAA
jgi:hypothetical protein